MERRVSLIAALSPTGVIGRRGQLPWHIPTDLKRFRNLTIDKPVIMGRRTFESLPGRRALPRRRNIVVSRRVWAWIMTPEIEVVNGLHAALRMVQHEPEVMIIGGGALFEAAIRFADRMYLTWVMEHTEGDTYFPEIRYSEWKRTGEWQPANDNCQHILYFEQLDRI